MTRLAARRLRPPGLAWRRPWCNAPAYATRPAWTPTARQANLAGGFRLRAGARRPVVLVDDLVTTGSSLAEAARVLAAGVPVLGAATVAATERRQ